MLRLLCDMMCCMTAMVNRNKQKEVEKQLTLSPAVIMWGQRQTGKTEIAWALEKERDAHYLNLCDRQTVKAIKKKGFHKYVAEHGKRLTIIDELPSYQRILAELPAIIAAKRQEGTDKGSFLLLAAHSLELEPKIRKALEGQISLVGVGPLDLTEVASPDEIDKLWLRGGLPRVFSAANEGVSFTLLHQMAFFLGRFKLLNKGTQVSGFRQEEMLAMLAYQHGDVLNKQEIVRATRLLLSTVDEFISSLCDMLVLRKLPAYRMAGAKGRNKTPKIYCRDSGLLHALLGARGKPALRACNMLERSWQGFAMENILRQIGAGVKCSHFSDQAGGEVDLVLEHPSGEVWAINISHDIPIIHKSFYSALANLRPDRSFAVHGRHNLRCRQNSQGVEIISLPEMCEEAYTARDPHFRCNLSNIA